MHATSRTFKLAQEPPNAKTEYFTLAYRECGPHSYAALDFTLTLTTAQYALRTPKGILLQYGKVPC